MPYEALCDSSHNRVILLFYSYVDRATKGALSHRLTSEMATDSELTEHALSSTEDFYELLGISAAAQEGEIRRAYRQTALKYHPDKVGNDQAKLDKFHLLQIAYDVLSDSTARQIYDNARRAKEEKKARESAYDDRRRHLKEELERREKAGVAGLKRKHEADDAEEVFQQTLRKLAADGKRRRKEREEQLRREAEEIRQEEDNAVTAQSTPQQVSAVAQAPDEFDRTVKVRYPSDDPAGKAIDADAVTTHFSRFGKIEHVMLKVKKVKEDGQKHRREYTTAFVVFKSVVGAHAAVTDFPDLQETAAAEPQDDSIWKIVKEVAWLGGKEPDCIPKPRLRPETEKVPPEPVSLPSTPKPSRGPDGLRKVPSFASFKGTPKATSSPSMEEITMIRLKNAERRRLAEKIRKEEAEAEAEEAGQIVS